MEVRQSGLVNGYCGGTSLALCLSSQRSELSRNRQADSLSQLLGRAERLPEAPIVNENLAHVACPRTRLSRKIQSQQRIMPTMRLVLLAAAGKELHCAEKSRQQQGQARARTVPSGAVFSLFLAHS